MKKHLLWVGVVGVGLASVFVIYRFANENPKPGDLKQEQVGVQTGSEISSKKDETTLNGYRVQNFVVNGLSMYPLLKSQDIVTGALFKDEGEKNINRYDIVVVKFKTIDKPLIKRVIGLPGDRVGFKDGVLLINGKPENQKYIYPKGYKYTSADTRVLDIQLKNFGGMIPEDMYLLLGDNRSESQDSRRFGLVDKSQIIGKIILY